MAISSSKVRRPAATVASLIATLLATSVDAIVVRHADTSTVYSVDLGVVYRACTAPNTTNSTGIPACAPPVTSACAFGGGGLKLQRKNRSANELELDASLTNVSGPGNCATGPYTLQFQVRITVDDPACTGGACTLSDRLVTIPLLPHSDDFIRTDFVFESALPGPIPAVANYEILSAVVIAPDGLPIAGASVDASGADTRGSLTVGYAQCTAPDTTNAWGAPACSGPVWTSPCDFRAATASFGSSPPATRIRPQAEDLVGAPAACADGTYGFAPRLRVTTSDCGMPCTLVDFDQPYPVAVEHGDIVQPTTLLASVLPFPLAAGDVVELTGARLLDPFGNLLGAVGATPALRVARARFFAAFRDPANATDDRITIKGLLPYAPLDPTVGGVTFTVNDKDGVVYTATIPAAAWEARTPGRKWRYKDDLGTIAGVRKAEVRETRHDGKPNGYKVFAVAETDASAADLPAADVVIAGSRPDASTAIATSGTICKVSSRRASCK